jgi:hypothetical protein
MKTYSIIAAVAAAAASLLAFTTPAAAQEIAVEQTQPIVVTQSRSAVQADALAARANGPLWVTEAGETNVAAVTRPLPQRIAAAPAAKSELLPKAMRTMASRGKPAWHAFEGDTGYDNTAAVAARVL